MAGVIFYGTEMGKEDYEIIRQIQKPLVVYDCEADHGNDPTYTGTEGGIC